MKKKIVGKRVLALFLLLTMILGLFPHPAMATGSMAEEKPATKAGKNYTTTINNLAKPAAAYSTHHNYELINYPNAATPGTKCTVSVGDYVMVVKYSGKVYAFNPMRNTSWLSPNVVAEPVTIDGDYLVFPNDTTAQNCTVTLKANTNSGYSYERLMVRRDGKAVEPIPYEGSPVFRVDTGNNQTYAFNYDTSVADGITFFKYLTMTGNTNDRNPYCIAYVNGSFSLQLLSEYPRLQDNNTFYFYRMTSITENLYNAIQSAKTYATGNANGAYDAELYAGFIALLEDCIQVYNDSNHYLTKEELKDKVALQSSLDSRADSLNAYMNYLSSAGASPNYANLMSKVPTSLGWGNYYIDLADRLSSKIYTGLNGTYYLACYSATTKKNYIIDPTKNGTEGVLGISEIKIKDNVITTIDGAAPVSNSQAFDLIYEEHPTKTNNNCYFLRTQDGAYVQANIKDGTPLLTLGTAHQAIGFDYQGGSTNARVQLYRNISNTVDKVAVSPNLNVYLSYNEGYKTATFITPGAKTSYRLFRLTWDTSQLRNALNEMAQLYKTYGSTAVTGVAEAFRTCYEESLGMYFKYNVSHSPEQLEQTTAIQAELKAQVTRLLSYKSILSQSNYAGVIQNLLAPYNEYYNEPLSEYHAMNIRYVVGGVFYIIHKGEDGTNRAVYLDQVQSNIDSKIILQGAETEISDGRILNGETQWAFEAKESSSGSTVYPYEFLPVPVFNTAFYVNANEAQTENNGPHTLSFHTGRSVAFQVMNFNEGLTLNCNKNFDSVSGNEKYFLQYVPSENIFQFQYDGILTPATRALYSLYLVSDHILELYRALEQVAVYATGNEDKRYPTEEYESFLTCLQESIALYQYYNTSVHEDWDTASLKTELNEQADTLLSHIASLTLSDTKADYIDIPMEILDFRADGFLFEYNDATYGMSHAANIEKLYGFKTGTLKAASNKHTNYTLPNGTTFTNDVHTNLTGEYLVKGNMVYGEKTLKQIAYSILSGISVIDSNIPSPNTQIKAKADDLIKKAGTYSSSSQQWNKILGSASATFAKTTTKENGGELLWEQIETAYDLAYYILTYLWRPVSSGDTMGDSQEAYNVSIPERAVLRMYRDESTGLYTLDSYSRVEHTGVYSYNAYPAMSNFNHAASPNFTPIDGLGFEKSSGNATAPDTDRSEHLSDYANYSTEGTNFHFTLHAKGSFVYYEEQNLYFEFLGDDDVYFYINGRRVMDLGGGHQAAGNSMYLNTIAGDWGLKDGDIYSFDMFYAERKTSASNLRFLTNMRLMDPNILTKKVQHNAAGDPLVDGAVVSVGEPISYSFEMENHNNDPIVNLSFSDPTLGIYMSKDNVTIDPALSETDVTDITLSYRSFNHDTGKLYNGAISYHSTFKYFENKLLSHVNKTAEPKGHYVYTVKSAGELQKILGHGIPENFLLTISGIVRKATEGKYVNTLTSSACPVTYDAAGNIIPLTPVYGNASRNLYGVDFGSINIPGPLQLVLDYGKPLALPMNDLWTRVDIQDPKVLPDYVGICATGDNGTIRKSRPLNLLCTSESDPYTMDCGTLALENGIPVFRLSKEMTHEEQIYTVHALSMKNSQEIIGYLIQEVQLLPATLMYYETDFTEDFVSIQHVKENGTKENAVTVKWDSTSAKTAPEEFQDNDPVVPGDAFVKKASEEKDYTHALFFDFSNTEQDAQRYTQPQYAGVNYDSPGAWLMDHSAEPVTQWELDNEAGTLSFNARQKFPKTSTSSVANRLDIYNATDLAFDPAYAEILQFRVKLENLSAYNNTPWFRLWWEGKKDSGRYQVYENGLYLNDGIVDGAYVTYTLDLRSIDDNEGTDYNEGEGLSGFGDMRSMNVITDIRFSFHNAACDTTSKITYDYIYIGPKNNAPVQHGHESLYFTFDNTDSDLMRYRYPQYNGLSPDTGDWSSFHFINTLLQGNNHAGGKGTHDTQPVIDNISGTITIPAYTWVNGVTNSNNLSFVLDGVNYDPSSAEVVEVRAKFLNISHCGETGSECTNLDFRYKTDINASGYTLYNSSQYKFKTKGDVTEEFKVFQITLGSDFRALDNLTTIRLCFENFFTTEDSRIVLDYIYIGPMADSPKNQGTLYSAPKDDFLYFGYDNDEDSAARYSSAVYKGINFDQMTDGTQTCWMARTAQANPSLTMDNAAGTLTVTANADPFNPTASSNADRFYFQTGVCGATTQPLNYSLGNADIAQVRLKFKGFTQRNNGQTPLLEFRAHTDGYVYDASADNCTVALSYTIPLDVRYLDAEEYITFSAPVLPGIAKYARLNTFRLDFLYFDWAEGANVGTVTIDYMYVGPADSAPDPVYGYDSSYDNDTKYSNHSSYYVEGTGVKLPDKYDANGNLTYTYTGPYTVGNFSFTGTGFDIIATTGIQCATIRVQVYDKAQNLIKQMSINTKGELELHQIPVVSVQGLAYGSYDVVLYVNNSVASDYEFLNRGNQFYFDAIRIYDPMDTTKAELSPGELHTVVGHLMDHEDRSHIKEIRNILLSAEKFAVLTGSGVGALFIDTFKKDGSDDAEDLNIDNHHSMNIETYNKVGPKNEVYLDPGQAVAFKLEIDSSAHAGRSLIPISLDVGAKTLTGKSADLVAAVVKAGSTTDSALTIATHSQVSLSTATGMYYPLNLTRDMLSKENNKLYCYVVLFNNSKVKDEGASGQRNADYVISLTDVKLCYVLDPNATAVDSPADPEIKPGTKAPLTEEESSQVSFMVDGNTPKAAALVIKSCWETLVLDEGTALLHSLDLASDISINYVLRKTELASYDSFYLECVQEGQQEPLQLLPVEKGDYYYFTLSGLSAVQMREEVTATLYMEKDGKLYHSLSDTYSIAEYALAQLDKPNVSKELKTLCANLLVYGAKAQLYKDYRCDSLADEAMTEEHRSYLTDLDTVTFGNVNATLSDLPRPTVTWVGKTLDLNSKVGVKYVIDLSAYTGDLSDLSLRLSYEDINGAEQSVTLTELSDYNSSKRQYAFTFEALTAAELRTVLRAQVYAGKTPVSVTMEYSPSAYGNNKTGTLLDLCKALFAYSDSARAFFA